MYVSAMVGPSQVDVRPAFITPEDSDDATYWLIFLSETTANVSVTPAPIGGCPPANQLNTPPANKWLATALGSLLVPFMKMSVSHLQLTFQCTGQAGIKVSQHGVPSPLLLSHGSKNPLEGRTPNRMRARLQTQGRRCHSELWGFGLEMFGPTCFSCSPEDKEILSQRLHQTKRIVMPVENGFGPFISLVRMVGETHSMVLRLICVQGHFL